MVYENKEVGLQDASTSNPEYMDDLEDESRVDPNMRATMASAIMLANDRRKELDAADLRLKATTTGGLRLTHAWATYDTRS
jgi:hypothetical protein